MTKESKTVQHTNVLFDHMVEMARDGFTAAEMADMLATAARWAADEVRWQRDHPQTRRFGRPTW